MRFFANYVFFLRFLEVFRVLALLFQKKLYFFGEKKRRRPLRTQVQGFGSQKCVFYPKSAFFWGEKPPEATAHTNPGLLVTKIFFLPQKCSFFGEKKRRRPLRTQVQGFWSQKCVFYSKSALWGGQKTAGGHCAHKSRAFGHKK